VVVYTGLSLAAFTDSSAMVGAVPDKVRLGGVVRSQTHSHSLAVLKSPDALMPRRAIPGPAVNPLHYTTLLHR
jgi:hypothetical protein